MLGIAGAPAAVAAPPSLETLQEAAQANGKPVSEIKKILADATAKLDARKRIYYVDPAPKGQPAPAFGLPANPAEPAPYPYAQTFTLHSQPGSNRVIYLDFNGETISGTGWNTGVLGGPTTSFYAEPFDTDGSPSTFSAAEQDLIQSVWQRVAEDYAPFNVDVTTQDPGAAAITRSGTGDTQFGTRALVTHATEIGSTCGCGGLAYLGVFDEPNNHAYYQPALMFAQNLANNAKFIAEATSHEVGHNLDLQHDGTFDGTTTVGYYQGHGAWAPIMGVGYYRPIAQWSKGEYLNANNLQDDLATIVANGAPLMADDAPNLGSGSAAAGPATGGNVAGVVTTDADSDVFEISASAGSATFTVTPAPNSPNLDAGLTLLDASFTALASSDPPSASTSQDTASGLGASITFVLPTSGKYYLAVDGRGVLNPLNTGYSGYGSLGAYTLGGTFTPPVTAPTVTEVNPIEDGTGVARSADVVVFFSKAMDRSATESAFSLKTRAGVAVPGSIRGWSSDSKAMIFDPDPDLADNTTYDAKVGTGARDTTGNALAAEKVWSFQTADATPPTVSSLSPNDAATGVNKGDNVVVTFSEAMNQSATQSAFSLKTRSGQSVSGAFSWNQAATVMTFNPASDLAGSTTYDAKVGTGARDTAGNALAADKTWSFQSGDATPPTITSRSPSAGATGVAVDTNIVLTFSESMNRSATVNAISIETSDNEPVVAAYSWNDDSTVLTYNPNDDLAEDTTYDVFVGTGARDAAGNSLAGSETWSFRTIDTTTPTVSSVSPAHGAAEVTRDANIVVTFSEPMDRSAAEDAFSLENRGGSSVAGAFSWNADSTVMTFDPASFLANHTTYDAEVGTGATDAAGNALATEEIWTFETVDTTPPSISSVSPADGAEDVARNTNVVVTFSEAMDRSSAEAAFSLKRGTESVSGAFSWNEDSTVMTFDPASDLANSSLHDAEVGTGVMDAQGNGLDAVKTWSFETADTVAPGVSSVSPADDTEDVARNANVVVTFSEAMDRSSAEGAFSLKRGTESVSGAFSWNTDSTVMTFDPDSDLAESSTYDAQVGTGATDSAGNPLASAQSWSFETVDTPPTVSSVSPSDGSTGVSRDADVVVTFSEAMDRTATQGAFSLKRGTETIPGAFSWNETSTVLTFNPASALRSNAIHTVNVATSATDAAGTGLASAFASSFSVEGPGVTMVDPANGATEVAVDRNVVVTFSEAMNRSATQGAFGLRKQGSTTKLGGAFTWNSASTVMTFNPTSNLLANTVYEIAVTTAAKDLAGNPLASPFASSFRSDATGPTVTLIDPADGGSDVAVDKNVVVTFSEPMTRVATQGAFGLRKQGSTTKLGGAFTWNSASTVMTFNPSANLLANTVYEIAVTTAAKDLAGNPLASPFASSFRTDATGPGVTLVDPANEAIDVAVDKNVVVTFSEPMSRTATQGAFGLRRQGSTTKLGGAFTWNSAGTVMTFNPTSNLLANTVYEIAVTTAAKDVAGNPLGSPFASSFRSDATGPTVTLVDPADGGSDVAVDKNVVVTFSEPMSRTATQGAFGLRRQGSTTKLGGAFTWNPAGTVMTFNPSANLIAGTVYEISVTTAARDLAGNPLGSPFASSFTSR